MVAIMVIMIIITIMAILMIMRSRIIASSKTIEKTIARSIIQFIELNEEKEHCSLGVILFRTLNKNFVVL